MIYQLILKQFMKCQILRKLFKTTNFKQSLLTVFYIYIYIYIYILGAARLKNYIITTRRHVFIRLNNLYVLPHFDGLKNEETAGFLG